jgi:hypothetical protein
MIMTNTLAYYDKDMNHFTIYFSMNKIWLKNGEFVWQIPVLLRNRFERDGKRDLSFFFGATNIFVVYLSVTRLFVKCV